VLRNDNPVVSVGVGNVNRIGVEGGVQHFTFFVSFKRVTFNLFHSRVPRYIFSSTLYPQSCWCIIQVMKSL
jgi:hypothetical protein